MEGGREEEMEEGMKDAGMLGLQACTAQLQLYPHLPTLPGGGRLRLPGPSGRWWRGQARDEGPGGSRVMADARAWQGMGMAGGWGGWGHGHE